MKYSILHLMEPLQQLRRKTAWTSMGKNPSHVIRFVDVVLNRILLWSPSGLEFTMETRFALNAEICLSLPLECWD